MSENRTGRGPGSELTQADWDEIGRITDEIMENYPANRSAFEYHVRRVLAKAIVAANEDYDATLKAEEVHRAPPPDRTYQYPAHSISECRTDFCGRHKGQRRNSR
jgi:hypothetical protein